MGGQDEDVLPLAPSLVAVLRQLSVGLGVHRLYGGRETAASGEAAGRVAEAVRAAQRDGDCEASVSGGSFVGVAPDDQLDRLARALFERRVELLAIQGVPEPGELTVLFEALSTEPGAVNKGGGVDAWLQARGVTAVRTSELVPDPASGEALADDLRGVARGTSVVVDDDDSIGLALELLPERDASVLFHKLRGVAARLPEASAARSSFYREVQVLAALLPADQQPRFDRLLLDASVSDPFAERALGHLTDIAVADLILRVARAEGVDPRPLAREVAGLGHRHANLPRLVLARGLAGRAGGEGAVASREVADRAGAGAAAGVAPTPDVASGVYRDPVAAEYGQSVADGYDELIATGRDLAAVSSQDDPIGAPATRPTADGGAHPLAVAFPHDEAAGRAIAATALVDVLRSEPREEHLLGLCASVEARLRRDVAAGHIGSVEELLSAWRAAGNVVAPDVARQLEATVQRVLDIELVVQALATSGAVACGVLQPFGCSAVGPIVAALEPDHPAEVRRAARQVLEAVAVDHLEAVAVAVAPRSAAARQQVVAALEGRTDAKVATVLGRLAQHSDRELQQRVLTALARADPVAAVPVIGGMVTRSRHVAVRRRGLELLASGGTPAGGDLLLRLGRRDTSPLPRRLRRRARRLAGG